MNTSKYTAVTKAYEKTGFSAACEVANKKGVPYAYCEACTTEVPHLNGECLICGRATIKRKQIFLHDETIAAMLRTLPAPSKQQIKENYTADYSACFSTIKELIECVNKENGDAVGYYIANPETFIAHFLITERNFTIKAANLLQSLIFNHKTII